MDRREVTLPDQLVDHRPSYPECFGGFRHGQPPESIDFVIYSAWLDLDRSEDGFQQAPDLVVGDSIWSYLEIRSLGLKS